MVLLFTRSKIGESDNCIKSSVIWELNFELFGVRGIYNSAICSKNCNLYLLSHQVRVLVRARASWAESE